MYTGPAGGPVPRVDLRVDRPVPRVDLRGARGPVPRVDVRVDRLGRLQQVVNVGAAGAKRLHEERVVTAPQHRLLKLPWVCAV